MKTRSEVSKLVISKLLSKEHNRYLSRLDLNRTPNMRGVKAGGKLIDTPRRGSRVSVEVMFQ